MYGCTLCRRPLPTRSEPLASVGRQRPYAQRRAALLHQKKGAMTRAARHGTPLDVSGRPRLRRGPRKRTSGGVWGLAKENVCRRLSSSPHVPELDGCPWRDSGGSVRDDVEEYARRSSRGAPTSSVCLSAHAQHLGSCGSKRTRIGVCAPWCLSWWAD